MEEKMSYYMHAKYCFLFHNTAFIIRAASWQNQQNGMCAQRRLRSAWASAQSDESIRCPHEESLGPYLPIERIAKALIRLGGCPGGSESSLGAQSFCWFCHEAAQLPLSRAVWWPPAVMFVIVFLDHTVFFVWKNFFFFSYHKTLKNSDTRKIAVLILKFKQCGSTIVSCVQKMQTELQTV